MPLKDEPKLNHITALIFIFSHLQFLVLLLFYTRGNLFPTLKLSDDVAHFRPILDGEPEENLLMKKRLVETHETHINIRSLSN